MKLTRLGTGILVVSVTAAAATGCGSNSAKDASAPPQQTNCSQLTPKAPAKSTENPPKTHLPSGNYSAIVKTNCGSFTIALDTHNSPQSAASFAKLARGSFYDGLIFHRIAPGFVIQGGDPLATGSGGPGYKTVELPPADATYPRGTVAMAKTPIERPGTGGSQFFIVTGEDAGLPADYAILGKVTSGLETVDRISNQELSPASVTGPAGAREGRPLQPVVIESITIKKRKSS